MINNLLSQEIVCDYLGNNVLKEHIKSVPVEVQTTQTNHLQNKNKSIINYCYKINNVN